MAEYIIPGSGIVEDTNEGFEIIIPGFGIYIEDISEITIPTNLQALSLAQQAATLALNSTLSPSVQALSLILFGGTTDVDLIIQPLFHELLLSIYSVHPHIFQFPIIGGGLYDKVGRDKSGRAVVGGGLYGSRCKIKVR